MSFAGYLTYAWVVLSCSLSSFLASMALFLRMVSVGENICDTYNNDFVLIALVFIISVKCQLLNFAVMGGTLMCLLLFARWALSIFDCINSSSRFDISVWTSFARMFAISAQDSLCCCIGMFLNMSVFLKINQQFNQCFRRPFWSLTGQYLGTV